MQWPTDLRQAIFLRRWKRFFADIEFPDGVQVAHVANTGSLKSALEPGQSCLVSAAANPERKLRWSLEAVRTAEGAWVGVNTSWPNKLAEEAFHRRLLPHWQEFDTIEREVKLSKETRLDLRLSSKSKQHFVEIKNVTLRLGAAAAFPDSVTTRGQKHLRELINLRARGHGAEILFVVQRADCSYFTPADDIDPEYGRLLREAHKAGVTVSAVVADISPLGLSLTPRQLEIRFP